MSLASFTPTIVTEDQPLPTPVPMRFYVGMASLFLLVIITYLLVMTPLRGVVMNHAWMNPAMTFLAAVVGGTLLLAACGTGELAMSHIIGCVVVVLTLGTAVEIYEVSVQFIMNGGHSEILKPLAAYLPATRTQAATAPQALFMVMNFVGFVVLEELAKLGPVLVMIRMRWIRSAQAAICCGALAGLTFGLIESNCYGYIDFLGTGQPITEWISRFVMMSAAHAMWDAIGAGLAMWLARRRVERGEEPPLASCLAAFFMTVLIHLCHNALQALIVPAVQVVTILGILLPVYALTKSAWRSSQKTAESLRPVPVALACALLLGILSATAMTWSWLPQRTGQQAALLTETADDLENLLDGKDAEIRQRRLTEIESSEPPLARVRQDIAQIVEYLREANGDQSADAVARLSLTKEGFSQLELRRSISSRRPRTLLNDIRYELNHASNEQELTPLNSTMRRWEIEVRSAVPGGGISAAEKFGLVLFSAPSLDDTLVPEELGPRFTGPLPGPWKTVLALKSSQPVIAIVSVDAHDSGRLLDAAILPFKPVDGELRMVRGSTLKISVQTSAQ